MGSSSNAHVVNCAVSRFLFLKELTMSKIYVDMQETLQDSAPHYRIVKRWVTLLKKGWWPNTDEHCSSCPKNVTTEDNMLCIQALTMQDHQVTPWWRTKEVAIAQERMYATIHSGQHIRKEQERKFGQVGAYLKKTALKDTRQKKGMSKHTAQCCQQMFITQESVNTLVKFFLPSLAMAWQAGFSTRSALRCDESRHLWSCWDFTLFVRWDRWWQNGWLGIVICGFICRWYSLHTNDMDGEAFPTIRS